MTDERPTFGSLFAGIGGIDLGLERAGWRGRWQVEYEPFCQRVLAKHWPDVMRYGDIHDVDWSGVEPVDLVAGGFPCQPVSSAGRQAAQDDARWLWPEFFRCVRALRPRLVLVENVTNLLAINGGSAFGDVLGDLATIGYDGEWDCIPAASVGAPHARDRVWLVAYPEGNGQPLGWSGDPGRNDHASGLLSVRAEPGGDGSGARATTVADTAGIRLEEPRRLGFASDPEASRQGQANHVVDGRWWLVEPDVGRVAHGVPARVDRLRSLGNAVVPQVVEYIGRRILEAEAMR